MHARMQFVHAFTQFMYSHVHICTHACIALHCITLHYMCIYICTYTCIYIDIYSCSYSYSYIYIVIYITLLHQCNIAWMH